jgi:hypothetical protein
MPTRSSGRDVILRIKAAEKMLHSLCQTASNLYQTRAQADFSVTRSGNIAFKDLKTTTL